MLFPEELWHTVIYYSEVFSEYAKKSGGLEKKWTLQFRITDSAFKLTLFSLIWFIRWQSDDVIQFMLLLIQCSICFVLWLVNRGSKEVKREMVDTVTEDYEV